MNNSLFEEILTDAMLSGKSAPKQKQILESAIKLFAEKGYANTSTSEIAKMAGIAEGTLFRYYKTKEALLQAVLIPCKLNLIPKISKDVHEIVKIHKFENYEEMLRFIIKNRISFLRENRMLFTVFIKEVIYRDDFRQECIPQLNKELIAYVNSVMDNAKKNGEIVNLSNQTIIRMIGSLLGGYFISRFFILPENMFMNDDDETELLIQIIANGIRIKQ